MSWIEIKKGRLGYQKETNGPVLEERDCCLVLAWRNCPVVVASLWLLGSCQNLQFHCGPKRGLSPGFPALLSVSFVWNCSCFTLSSSVSASLTLWVGWFSVVSLCCAVWNIVCGLYSLAGQSTTQLRQLRFLDIARCSLGMCACTIHKA